MPLCSGKLLGWLLPLSQSWKAATISMPCCRVVGQSLTLRVGGEPLLLRARRLAYVGCRLHRRLPKHAPICGQAWRSLRSTSWARTATRGPAASCFGSTSFGTRCRAGSARSIPARRLCTGCGSKGGRAYLADDVPIGLRTDQAPPLWRLGDYGPEMLDALAEPAVILLELDLAR